MKEDGVSEKRPEQKPLLVFVAEIVAACAVTFIATVLFEALKILKVSLTHRLTKNPLAEVQNLHSQDGLEGAPDTPNTPNTHDEVVLLSSLQFPATVEQIRNQK